MEQNCFSDEWAAVYSVTEGAEFGGGKDKGLDTNGDVCQLFCFAPQ